MAANRNAPQPNSGNLLAAYRRWASQQLGGTASQIDAAATTLLQAQQQGLSQQAAIEAARAAHREAGFSPSPPTPSPAPPGKVVGIARNVEKRTEFGNFLQILSFELETPSGQIFRVEIRGDVINGSIELGDEIVVDAPKGASRFIQADRVFNKSWNTYVEAPRGMKGLFAQTEATYGKGMARAHRGIVAVISLAVLVGFALVIGGLVLGSCDTSEPSSPDPPTAPAWWCEDARNNGWEDPPNC